MTEFNMTIAIALLLIAAFVLLIGVRVAALVGRDGAVHTKVPGVREAVAYRRRLERKLHANS
jgi:hypothetical protein